MTTQMSYKNKFSQFEYEGWRDLSCEYGQCWGHVTSSFLPPILSKFANIKGKKLLDIATGPGYGAGLAAEAGALATGVDFSREMISQAKSLYHDAEFYVADALNLPFEKSSFDLAISNFGFQHFSDPSLVFSQVARVLKCSGVLKFTIWAESDRNSASLILEEALHHHGTKPSAVPEGPDYHSFFENDNFYQTLEMAGFDVSETDSQLVVVPWALKYPDELFLAELSGSVRSGAQLRQESAPGGRAARPRGAAAGGGEAYGGRRACPRPRPAATRTPD